MAKTVFYTTVGQYAVTLPSDFVALDKIEVIGGGGGSSGGRGGGGGGAYAMSNNITGLVAGNTVYVKVGAGAVYTNAGNSWFNTTNTKPTSANTGCLAEQGSSAVSTEVGAAGGTTANSVGVITYAGGTGGTSSAGGSGCGGGGAAGPNGAGGNGGGATGDGDLGMGGGGGSNGGSNGSDGTNASSGAGGDGYGNGYVKSGGGLAVTIERGGINGAYGTGGGGSGAFSSTNDSTLNGGDGAPGSFWTQTTPSAFAGSGGGGGGASNNGSGDGGAGGLFGGGGGGGSDGAGAQGIVVLTYLTAQDLGPRKTIFYTTVGRYGVNLPSDFQSLDKIEAIGGGGAGSTGSNANYPGSGGGGAYAMSNNVSSLTANQLVYIQVGSGSDPTTGSPFSNGANSWFNTTNEQPTLSTTGCLAVGGLSGQLGVGGTGGQNTSCVGTVVYSGGNGVTTNISGNGRCGGGAAAGPLGKGGNGATNSSGTGASGGGGGGSNGGSNGSVGSGSTAGAGGNGYGNGLTLAGGGGFGFDGKEGTGGGGGGAASGNSVGGHGASGAFWIESGTGATAGSGGGGGGPSGSSGVAGNGGLFGGGGAANGNGQNSGWGAQGIVVLTYYAKPTTNKSKFYTWDPVEGKKDLDDVFVTDSWLVDKYVGNQLFTWGYGALGLLGDGTTVDKSSPIQIGSLTNWKQIAADDSTSDSFASAIKTDGTLWQWGDPVPLGDGTGVGKSSPVQIGILTHWKKIVVSSINSFAITNNNSLYAWGNNLYGQLGDGTTISKSSPIQIGSLTNWKELTTEGNAQASSPSFARAIKTDGTLWAWGRNDSGQLGDGTTVDKSSPIQIGSLTNWKEVSGLMAIKTDGTLWGWGSNSQGQLGDGTVILKSSPVQIGTLTNWKKIFNTDTSTFAIKTDGTLWAWGSNTSGALGDGTTLAKSSPIQIGALTNWKQIAKSAAIKTDGTLWIWGTAFGGQLGDGTTLNKSSPIQIGTLTNWKQVSRTQTGLAITFNEIT